MSFSMICRSMSVVGDMRISSKLHHILLSYKSTSAMASHIPDGGHCLVVYGPHVGVDSTGAVGTVERVGRANGGACCGSAIAAAGYVESAYLGESAKYGPSLAKLGEGAYKKAFEAVDSNKDGVIDKVEALTLLIKLDISLTQAEFDAAFAEMDTSGDGNISMPEFAAWFRRHKHLLAA